MDWNTGLIRLWAVASVVWVIAVSAVLRLDITLTKLVNPNFGGYSPRQGFTAKQLAILDEASARISSSVYDDFIHGLILILVPILTSLFLIKALKWVIAGFKGE
jgi:hypothetical protein